MSEPCEHVDLTREITPSGNGCQQCLETGQRWVKLRVCMSCGNVGCCDSSPGQHATGHWNDTQHPVMRSFEPGEDWWWCYPHERGFEVPDAAPAPSYD